MLKPYGLENRHEYGRVIQSAEQSDQFLYWGLFTSA